MKAWREVIEPNDDVAGGRYEQSEFAADLAQVVEGKGSGEYRDAQKFFSRTYLTGGLKSLLVNTLQRLSGSAGDPVIQLKTAFGGGKTHSMIALYHLFGGKIRAEQSITVEEIMNAAEVKFIPKVHTAVVVGATLNALHDTLWGELARQLSASTSKPELYEMMRENDEAGVAPGRALLEKMFAEAGACLILIDELVLYGRQLREDKTRCNVDNLMTFAQELTEAAKACDRVALVVSLPSSKTEEVGDAQGEKILRALENVFRRVESVWSAATAEEGYEIVRRRLFKECSNKKARDEACDEFFKMYSGGRAKYFPSGTRQKEYRERLRKCYPIHPQLFDFFYEKWTGLEGFQKTRGVLRLMARVLHCLWMRGDRGGLILPGDIPLDDKPVHDELTKLLKGNWGSIADGEVDGENSEPYNLDGQKKFGKWSAARKIARTIFMGTAPGSRESLVRGLDEKEIRLGAIEPSGMTGSVFNDALSALKGSLYYLYSQGDRLWFGVTPTLRKWVDDKRETYSAADIEYEIEKHIDKKWRQRLGEHIKSVHIFPRGSEDIPDDQTVRLVILSPKFAYAGKIGDNAATIEAEKILKTRGEKPRRYQNMVLFMAADAERLRVLDAAVREYKAWSEALDTKTDLNLDDIRRKDANNNLKSATTTFEMKVSQAYGKILAPRTAEKNVSDIHWEVEDINCLSGENIAEADKKFSSAGLLYDCLGEQALKRLLDEFLWRDSDSLEKSRLPEYFMMYCYLPRLTDPSVLFAAINRGDSAKPRLFVLKDEVLYKDVPVEEPIEPPTEIKSIERAVEVERDIGSAGSEESAVEEIAVEEPAEPEVEPPPTHFAMHADVSDIDPARWRKIFINYINEVVSNFANIDGEVTIRFSVEVNVPDGISSETEKIVADNCKSLGVKDFHFD